MDWGWRKRTVPRRITAPAGKGSPYRALGIVQPRRLEHSRAFDRPAPPVRLGARAAGQLPGERLARRGDPALDRSQRPAQLACPGFVGVALQQAEDHGKLLLLGQAAYLLIYDRADLVTGVLLKSFPAGGWFSQSGLFADAPPGGVGPGAAGYAQRHAVKPV
jgi:hypothetical protein